VYLTVSLGSRTPKGENSAIFREKAVNFKLNVCPIEMGPGSGSLLLRASLLLLVTVYLIDCFLILFEQIN
jgi:hypothetical protein